MLVYHKDPLGYCSVGDKRIYGEFFAYGAFGPTEMTYKDFNNNRSFLKEEPITGAWLKKKFNKDFPEIQFKITKMWKVDFDKLVTIARIMGINYIKPRYPKIEDKRALKKAVINKIDTIG